MMGSGQITLKRSKRLLFVNKKKQKNFTELGRAGSNTAVPVRQKFFAPLFSKKAAAFLSSLKPVRL
jgi:hypothetical protein